MYPSLIPLLLLIVALNVNAYHTDYLKQEVSNRREKCKLIGINNKEKLTLNLVFGIGIVRFENGVCNSSSNLEGTCYTRYQCRSVSGFASGRCASNIGICCVSKYITLVIYI